MSETLWLIMARNWGLVLAVIIVGLIWLIAGLAL